MSLKYQLGELAAKPDGKVFQVILPDTITVQIGQAVEDGIAASSQFSGMRSGDIIFLVAAVVARLNNREKNMN